MGNPSSKDIKTILCVNMIKNVPIPIKYITTTENIFVPYVALFKFKTVTTVKEKVNSYYIHFPNKSLDQNK